jgi:hypothetical protein
MAVTLERTRTGTCSRLGWTAAWCGSSRSARRRRDIDVAVVWRLDSWGRSISVLLATRLEPEQLGVGVVSLTQSSDPTTPVRQAMAGLLVVGDKGPFDLGHRFDNLNHQTAVPGAVTPAYATRTQGLRRRHL